MSIFIKASLKHFNKAFAILGMISSLMLLVVASNAQAKMVSFDEAKNEMSIGKIDAPVTLHEYASLTCGHCAKFHNTTLPEIKKEYVDTGKVRIVFHDFPLDNLAKGAVMIARCAGPERFADFTSILFETQHNWRDSNNPLASLKALVQFYGVSADEVTTCLTNQGLLDFVQTNRDTASAKHGINSTPTFIVNGKKIEGAQPFDVFKKALDKALEKTPAN